MKSADHPIFRPPDDSAAPGGDDIVVTTGSAASPVTRDMTFRGRDGEPVRVYGQLLAFGTSERDAHSHPVDASLAADDPGRYASRSERCSACRWFEVNVVRVIAEVVSDDCTCGGANNVHEKSCGTEPPSGRYLVVTAGRTVVPGEVDFRRAEFTDSPHEVVELLVQHRPGSGRAFIPQTSARVLAHAAAFDDDLRDAYLARTAL